VTASTENPYESEPPNKVKKDDQILIEAGVVGLIILVGVGFGLWTMISILID
jgi:cytoskeletal protein RodZ